MRCVVTGMSGTVAPVLAHALTRAGHEVAAWDRSRVPIDRTEAGRNFLRETRAEAVFHVATGPAEWAGQLAALCAAGGIPFLLTGTVSVFSEAQQGPFALDAIPEPDDDYGRYKLDCEHRVRAAHPDARIVRLGWQIGTDAAGNHMAAHLERQAREHGHIEASREWIPACSFLDDTAAELVAIATTRPPGLYHLDGNPGLTFHEIATALNRLRGSSWTVRASDAPSGDRRLLDPRIRMRSIAERLRAPGAAPP